MGLTVTRCTSCGEVTHGWGRNGGLCLDCFGAQAGWKQLTVDGIVRDARQLPGPPGRYEALIHGHWTAVFWDGTTNTYTTDPFKGL